MSEFPEEYVVIAKNLFAENDAESVEKDDVEKDDAESGGNEGECGGNDDHVRENFLALTNKRYISDLSGDDDADDDDDDDDADDDDADDDDADDRGKGEIQLVPRVVIELPDSPSPNVQYYREIDMVTEGSDKPVGRGNRGKKPRIH